MRSGCRSWCCSIKTRSLAGYVFRRQGFMPARLDQVLAPKRNDGGRLHPRLSMRAAWRGAAQAGFAAFAPAWWLVGQVGHAWAACDVVQQGTHCSPLAVKLFRALKCFSAASFVRWTNPFLRAWKSSLSSDQQKWVTPSSAKKVKVQYTSPSFRGVR